MVRPRGQLQLAGLKLQRLRVLKFDEVVFFKLEKLRMPVYEWSSHHSLSLNSDPRGLENDDE